MLDWHELEARRSERRRSAQRRRRRRVAFTALAGVAIVAAVVIAVGTQRSSPSPSTRSARQHPATTGRDRAARTTKRNGRATPPARPGLAPGAGTHASVPILMYHVIAAPPVGAPFPELYVIQTDFAAEMRGLYRAGYTAVTMDQLWAAWTGQQRLPPGRPVVISFDNGYRSQYRAAFPILRRYGWPGVENIQLTGLPRSQGGISPFAIRRMVASGWELDTQGFSHADLPTLAPAALHHEVADARRVVELRYHVPVHWFCYPSGHYDARVLAAVRAAGYRGATTVIPGWARRTDDPFRLPRLRVVAGTTPAQLLAQIAAARNDPAAPATYGVQ